MNDKSQKSESFTEMLLYAVDCIRYTEQISALHDCNDCGDMRNCKYCPKPGEFTRINCPLWKEK